MGGATMKNHDQYESHQRKTMTMSLDNMYYHQNARHECNMQHSLDLLQEQYFYIHTHPYYSGLGCQDMYQSPLEEGNKRFLQSQSSTSSTASRPGVVAPRGSAVAAVGMHRRRLIGGSSFGSDAGSARPGSGSNMLRFYRNDAPGLKISPNVVLVMSVCFISFVTTLHVFGKLYRSKFEPEP